MAFKKHPIYGDYFSVSENGDIFSHRTNKILKTYITHSGYETFTTRFGSRTGKCIGFRVHRLVAETYIPNPENKPEVNHIDGNKRNNHVSNLEWVTGSENVKHSFDIGLNKPKKGTKNSSAKLTEEQVLEIRSCVDKTSRELGELYGLHHTNISRIRRNASYN